MDKKIGFIGCGQMATAIIGGLMADGQIESENIWVYDHKAATNLAMQQQYGITPATDLQQLTSQVNILIVAVKPNVILHVLKAAATSVNKEAVVVSIGVGVTLDTLAKTLGVERKIIRAMPNTPAMVNEGMTSLTPNARVSQHELEEIEAIFNCLGKTAVVDEKLIHAVTGVSGSAPASVFMFIEAMADAAVAGGMPRSQAYVFAAQAVKGSAQMVLDKNKHPGELKDMVCSPGGTTIEAVTVLEKRGFRSAVIESIRQCMAKSEMLSR